MNRLLGGYAYPVSLSNITSCKSRRSCRESYISVPNWRGCDVNILRSYYWSASWQCNASCSLSEVIRYCLLNDFISYQLLRLCNLNVIIIKAFVFFTVKEIFFSYVVGPDIFDPFVNGFFTFLDFIKLIKVI